ncbi:MAG: hypothetical protein HZA35_03910 [Parcubacteria group bacterium]|nr:hypothetical protein [Parcubacteria group bacterium]
MQSDFDETLKELLDYGRDNPLGIVTQPVMQKEYVFKEDSSLAHYKADAYVVRCTDNRFWSVFKHFIKYLGFEDIDAASPPGGAKVFASPSKAGDREVALDKIKLLMPVHHIRRVVLFTHTDCAAYGGLSRFNGDEENEFEFHSAELKKAAEIVRERFPELAVETYFIDHKGIIKVN